MRITLLGPGEVEYHFQELLKIPKSKFISELESISQTLVDSDVELDLLPDTGVSLEIARLYKKHGGKKVVATLPLSDKTFGIKHLEKYRNELINGKQLFDEEIDTGDWYKHDLTKGLFGNAILYLGNSPGTEIERNGAVYLYKLMKGFKENLDLARDKINPNIIADNNLSLLVYSPFIIGGNLSKEDESYIERFGIKLFYIKDSKELKSIINKLR
ncbi:MAG: hypothetical protein WC867_00190 [Candidatus Pacearchaeota archaeon]|jgi:hypothetical protein